MGCLLLDLISEESSGRQGRVHELAKELGVTSKELLATLKEQGEFVKSASSTVEAPVARRLRESFPSAGGAETKSETGAALRRLAPRQSPAHRRRRLQSLAHRVPAPSRPHPHRLLPQLRPRQPPRLPQPLLRQHRQRRQRRSPPRRSTLRNQHSRHVRLRLLPQRRHRQPPRLRPHRPPAQSRGPRPGPKAPRVGNNPYSSAPAERPAPRPAPGAPRPAQVRAVLVRLRVRAVPVRLPVRVDLVRLRVRAVPVRLPARVDPVRLQVRAGPRPSPGSMPPRPNPGAMPARSARPAPRWRRTSGSSRWRSRWSSGWRRRWIPRWRRSRRRCWCRCSRWSSSGRWIPRSSRRRWPSRSARRSGRCIRSSRRSSSPWT